jgi:hypothetical protein
VVGNVARFELVDHVQRREDAAVEFVALVEQVSLRLGWVDERHPDPVLHQVVVDAVPVGSRGLHRHVEASVLDEEVQEELRSHGIVRVISDRDVSSVVLDADVEL